MSKDINDLPPELLTKVLRYLSVKDQLEMMDVCSLWHSIVEDIFRNCKVLLFCGNKSYTDFQMFLVNISYFQMLEHLSLDFTLCYHFVCTEQIETIFKHCRRLRSCKINAALVEFYEDAFHFVPLQLETLEIINHNERAFMDVKLISYIAARCFDTLKHLKVKINSVEKPFLMQICNSFPLLETLDLSGSNFSVIENFLEGFTHISKLSHIRCINLEKSYLIIRDENIINMIKHCHHLESITLCGAASRVSTRGLTAFSYARNLKYLQLDGFNFTVEQIQMLFRLPLVVKITYN